MVDRTQWRFYFANAGYPPGRVVRAAQLAKAIVYAGDRGWTVEWHPNEWVDDSWMSEREREHSHKWYSPCLVDSHGRVLASLGGVADPSYVSMRIVEAELALEAMTSTQHSGRVGA